MPAPMSETTFWILTALTDERRHGYAILRDVEALSGGTAALRVTTLYAALERLTRTGFVVEAGEEIVDGRARRYYALTHEGGVALGRETEALEARVAAARGRLRAHPSPGTRAAHA